jgi:hypothetical protein
MIQVQRLPWLFGGRTRYDCEWSLEISEEDRSIACEKVLTDFRDVCSPILSICEEILSGNWDNIAADFESILVERAKKENILISRDLNWLHSLTDTALFDALFRRTTSPENFWTSFFLNPRQWLHEIHLNEIYKFSLLKDTVQRLFHVSLSYQDARDLVYDYLRKLGLSEGIACLQNGRDCVLDISYVSQDELRQTILKGDGTTRFIYDIPIFDRIPYQQYNAETVDAFMSTWNPIFNLPYTSNSLTIESFVGEGHFGSVFKAFDSKQNIHVAIKLERYSRSEDYSKILKISSNPRIAKWIARPISEVIISEGLPLRYQDTWLSQPGLAMEFVETYEGSKVSDFCIVIQVMSAAKAFVDEGISHGDMKRENILYSKEVVSIHPKFEKCPKIKIIDLDSLSFIDESFDKCNYLKITYGRQFRLKSYYPNVIDPEFTKDELEAVISHLTEIFSGCEEEMDEIFEILRDI